MLVHLTVTDARSPRGHQLRVDVLHHILPLILQVNIPSMEIRLELLLELLLQDLDAVYFGLSRL